ncbi:unnamed protein product, partial [Amoebophrya sp. A120]
EKKSAWRYSSRRPVALRDVAAYINRNVSSLRKGRSVKDRNQNDVLRVVFVRRGPADHVTRNPKSIVFSRPGCGVNSIPVGGDR